jgi:ATP-dependent DNA helicase RecG
VVVQEAKELFKKLKIYTLLDLALILPSGYSDNTLCSTIEVGKVQTLEVKVIASSTSGGKFRVTFEHVQTHRRIYATFFKATPYHYAKFALNSHHYIQGKVDEYKGYIQISQPKSIKDIGAIIPRYKCAIKESEIKALIQAYINEKNLFEQGLDSYEVLVLMSLHFPKSLSDIYENGNLKSTIVQKLKFIEAYNHIKKLQNKKIDFKPMMALRGDIKPFVDALPFSLTTEQNRVIEEIREDLSNENKAAKRMIVGDVGSGKTMVILASVMMAYPHKSMLMAPTSILAVQIYQEALKYLPKHIKIALITQSNMTNDYKDADFIIGTHALLYKDDLPQTPLVMVDEQHRFGTNQRAMLEALVSKDECRPHYLQFSATPIPRTQAMIDSAMIDVSLITTTPFEKDITTTIISKNDFASLLAHIKSQIEQNHQTLIIYPLVEPSDEIPYKSLQESQDFWMQRFPGVYVTHGKDKNKEEVLSEFKDKGNILLATTVVEVGISLPRLTTIVIVGAERMGLASLHQLRGRVGRNGLKSWCYLFVNNPQNERLSKFAKTTNGFDIARLDLEYRNSGDILDGTIQSGVSFRWLDMANDEEIILQAKNRAKLNPNPK